MPAPEQTARQKIDLLLQSADWEVQDRLVSNLYAGQTGIHSVAVDEFSTESCRLHTICPPRKL